MKNKKKYVMYVVSAMILIIPTLALAQFQKPGGTGLPEAPSATGIIRNIMFWVLMIVGIGGVLGFAWAGILYLTAGGDDTKAGKAKKAMMNSLIGVVVALAGLVAINAAQNLLGNQKEF